MYTRKQTDGPWHHMTPGGCWFPWSTFSSSGRKQNNNQNSDWQWQALPGALTLIMTSSGRKNTRTQSQGDMSDATQCKHNLLANKQSALCSSFFSFITSLSVSEIPCRSDLPNCAAWHTSSSWEKGNEGKQILSKHEPRIWIHFVAIHLSFTCSVSLPQSLSLPRCPSICLFSSI